MKTFLGLKTKENEIHRFKNGAILKVTVNGGGKATVELVYDGEIDEEKKTYVYYVSDPSVARDKPILHESKKYQIIGFPSDLEGTIGSGSGDEDEDEDKEEGKEGEEGEEGGKNYTFYLIRHGQAEHNIQKGLSKYTGYIFSPKEDTNLTAIGITQATKIGERLYDILLSSGYYDSDAKQAEQFLRRLKLFASDLRRTHQTMAVLMNVLISKIRKGVEARIPEDAIPRTIVVLPCAHEVDLDGCDSPALMNPPENVMSCKMDKRSSILEKLKDRGCLSVRDGGVMREDEKSYGFEIYWDYYLDFYGGKTRRSASSTDSRKCSHTNFILQAVFYIYEETVKRSRRRRLTQKKRTQKKRQGKRRTRKNINLSIQ